MHAAAAAADEAATAAAMTLEIDVLTLFPAMLDGPARARASPGGSRSRAWPTIRVHDLRDWGLGRHRSVDDAPYGGGAGMVLRPEPVAAALDALRRPDSIAILLDPGGEVFRQARAADLADADAPASSSARATRASTSASARSSTSSSRSATTS